LVKRILEGQGYKVLQAVGGVDAQVIAKRFATPIDLLVTDVVLAGNSGREVYEELKALLPDLKVLFMSGYSEDIVARHGVLHAGTRLIQKPFTVEQLVSSVRRVLDKG
jgi:two-component system, cell cycle sensor histidine kinase and response regulator CckA